MLCAIAVYQVLMQPSVFETNVSYRNNLRRMFTENLRHVPSQFIKKWSDNP